MTVLVKRKWIVLERSKLSASMIVESNNPEITLVLPKSSSHTLSLVQYEFRIPYKKGLKLSRDVSVAFGGEVPFKRLRRSQAEPEKKKSPWLDVGFAQRVEAKETERKGKLRIFVENIEGMKGCRRRSFHPKMKMLHRNTSIFVYYFFWIPCVWAKSSTRWIMSVSSSGRPSFSNISAREAGFWSGRFGMTNLSEEESFLI